MAEYIEAGRLRLDLTANPEKSPITIRITWDVRELSWKNLGHYDLGVGIVALADLVIKAMRLPGAKDSIEEKLTVVESGA